MTEIENESKAVPPSAVTPPTPPTTPEMQKMQLLMRKLMDVCTTLVIKVATCNCNHRNGCAVYAKSKAIAEIIDEIQELRPKGA